MTSTFVRPSERGSTGELFRPVEFADAEALVFEPLQKMVTKHNGKDRLEIVADVTVFDDFEDIEQGKPSRTVKGVLTHGRIAAVLHSALIEGRPVAGCIDQGQVTVHGTLPWELFDLDEEAEALLQDWLKGRGEQR